MFKKAIIGALPLLMFANCAMAEYGSTNINLPININVLKPMSLSVSGPLQVGTVLPGQYIASGDNMSDVTVTGSANAAVSVSQTPTAISLTSDPSVNLQGLLVSFYGKSSINFNSALDSKGQLKFEITIYGTLPADTKAGTYTGTTTTTVTYI